MTTKEVIERSVKLHSIHATYRLRLLNQSNEMLIILGEYIQALKDHFGNDSTLCKRNIHCAEKAFKKIVRDTFDRVTDE